jgi:hypothetical protein
LTSKDKKYFFKNRASSEGAFNLVLLCLGIKSLELFGYKIVQGRKRRVSLEIITHVTLVFADVISGIAQEGLEIFPK